jgi:hypothetical protein
MTLVLRILEPGKRASARRSEATSVVRATREAGTIARGAAIGTVIDVVDAHAGGVWWGGKVLARVTRKL